MGTRQPFRSCAPSSAYVDAEAPAAPKFPSCDALTKKWLNGFAKGPVDEQAVRDGDSRPATTPLAKQVYRTNHAQLDRDKDGTACQN